MDLVSEMDIRSDSTPDLLTFLLHRPGISPLVKSKDGRIFSPLLQEPTQPLQAKRAGMSKWG